MMKYIYPVLSILLFHFPSFSQDTISSVKKRVKTSIQTGISYKTFLGDKYIEPTEFNFGDRFEEHQYERFTKVPTFGYNIGIVFTYKCNQRWAIALGVVYYLKKDIYENNQDTVIKYGNNSYSRDIQNILKYNYTYNNIEIPILAEYLTKKFNFYAGAYISVLTYKKANYIYVVNQFPNNPTWTTSNKIISGFEYFFKLYSTVQLSYNAKLKKLGINPFAAIYYGIDKQKDLHLQLGIIFPLTRSK